MRIAIVGGTGKEGFGLATRWARAGYAVVIGSRDADRAKERAARIGVDGMANEEAARAGDVVVLTVPYAAHAETLRGLRGALVGKILIDVTVPLRPPRVNRVHLPQGHAAALEAQAILGPGTPVVATLHHVGHTVLDRTDEVECDVLVATDDDGARETTMRLLHDLGLHGLDAGPLANAVALESLTPILLHLNRRYACRGAGVRFTGFRSD